MAVGGSSVSEVVREAEPAASAVLEHGVLEAAVDPRPAEAEEAAAVAVDSEITNWVEMPVSTLRWILARTREGDPVPTLEEHGIYTEEDMERKDPDKLIRRMIATLQAAQDDLFEFQAWVREVYLRNGRVMVPEDVVGPKDELQKTLHEDWGDWGDAIQLVGDAVHPEPQGSDSTDSSTNQVLPSE